MASKAEEIDVDGVAVRLTNRDKPYFPKLGSKGTKGASVRLLPVRCRPDGESAARQTRSPAAVPRRHRGRGDLPETGAAEAPRLLGDLSHHVSVRPHGRRAEGDASVGDRVGRPDGHRHTASVAGALPGHRASRRTAHRPRPAAGHRLQGGQRDRRRRAQAVARRARTGRLSEDVRRSRRARVPAHQARLGFHRRSPGRHRAGPRGGAAGARRRHHVVVEGGARQAAVHRLQPERARPHLRVGVLGAQDARSRRCRRR